MNMDDLYRAELMQHYRQPHNRVENLETQLIGRGTNPRCGDEIEIGVDLIGDRICRCLFRARACALCVASASLLTETVTGFAKYPALDLVMRLDRWISAASTDELAPPHPQLASLATLASHPARRRCALLPWQAFGSALAPPGP